jgi:hypothetical protein
MVARSRSGALRSPPRQLGRCELKGVYDVAKRGLAILPIAGFLMMSTGAAVASNSYQGDDVSYTVNTNANLMVCDKEADGHGVHADGDKYEDPTGNTHIRVDDPDGAGGDCGISVSTSGIQRHRTVEELSWKPDIKAEWNYHG